MDSVAQLGDVGEVLRPAAIDLAEGNLAFDFADDAFAELRDEVSEEFGIAVA